MNKFLRLTLPASMLVLGGCAQSPIDVSQLESKIGQAKDGDFGTCYVNVHSAAVALDEAEAGLATIKAHQGWTSNDVYDAALKAANKAAADRAAAEEACYVRTAALEAEMPGIKSTLADHEMRLKKLERIREIVRGVTFVTGSAQLTPQARTTLDVVANRLQRSETHVEVAGHASSTGTPERNMALSQARAESVRAYLMSRGVDGKMLTAKGYGITQPIASNNTRDGRRANQRVELRYNE